MIILAFETATMQGSIALMGDNHLIAEYSLNITTTHSERLLKCVETMLDDAQMTLDQVDGFAISSGPGSFTGLRIGLATVKGLSFATHKPVAGVPTLDAMAWQFTYSSYLICPCLDARKQEIYTALYRAVDGTLETIVAPMVVEPEKFVDAVLQRYQQKIIFTGNGVEVYLDLLSAKLKDRFICAPHFLMIPRAASVAELGMARLKANLIENIIAFEPIYLRKSEAEIKWSEKQNLF